MKKKNIPFSPPDIGQKEIDAVVDTLNSGWITSGPKVAKFEEYLANYCSADYAVAVYSATSAMELLLKVLNITEGDDIIVPAYTYTSTALVSLHRGIKPTMVDVKKDSFLIDIDKIETAITPKTKAIFTVDIAGVPVDYDNLRAMLKKINREDIALISDSAHAFGAMYKGKKVGSQCDFHVFSFHAVKNLTTAEGGAITFNNNNFSGIEDIYRQLKLNSLCGQSKDALAKTKAGAWKYDILTDGFKCNMTDIMASIGLVQLERYDGMLDYRSQIFDVYNETLSKKGWAIIPFSKNGNTETSYHLYTLRIKGFNEEKRDALIQELAEMGIGTNVHFIPLPMFTLYKNLGYNISDYPNTYAQYENEITLPVYSKLSLNDAKYVVEELVKCVDRIISK